MRRAHPSAAVRAAASSIEANAAPSFPRALLVADLLALLLLLAYVVALWRQAGAAVFASDECFHAHVSTWIAAHGRLPRELPEFYSGLPYFYSPLLHLLGAGVVLALGVGALAYLNVVLAGLLLVLLAVAPIRLPRTACVWAALVTVTNVTFTGYAVRFYVEILATALAVLVTVLLLRLRARPGLGAAIGLGIASGAALLAKQTAVVIPGVLVALAAFYAMRGERRLASALAVSAAVALVVAMPFLVRNMILYHHPLIPPITTEPQRVLEAMNRNVVRDPPSEFYRKAMVFLGPFVPWLAAAALLWGLLRRRFDLALGLLALCAGFVVVAPWVPRFLPRHLLPFAGAMALLASLALHDALRRVRWAPVAGQVLLLGAAAFTLWHLPNLRPEFNAEPVALEAYRAIHDRVPPGATVLSLNTYDTFYYSGRNATWPIPWGSSAEQLPLFIDRDPARFDATLRRLGIGYLLVPRTQPSARFDGASYPESLVESVFALIRSGRLRLVWQSRAYALIARAD